MHKEKRPVMLWRLHHANIQKYKDYKFKIHYFNKTVTNTTVVSWYFPLKIISTTCGVLALNRSHVHACIRTIQETALLLRVNVP